MTDSTDGESMDRSGHPPSWYAFTLAIFLLFGAGIANVAVGLEAANRLAGYAYGALVVGVALRVAEFTRFDHRVAAALRRATDRAPPVFDRVPVPDLSFPTRKRGPSGGLGSASRRDGLLAPLLWRVRQTLGRVPVPDVPQLSLPRGVRRAGTRVRQLAGVERGTDTEVEAGIRLSIRITILAGTVLVVWWWVFDPARTVSVTFLTGWALVLLVQLWLLAWFAPAIRRSV